MLTVKLTTASANWPIERQIPENLLRAQDVRFEVNNAADDCDYWFIVEGLSDVATVRVNPDNVWFITNEPPDIRSYHPAFLNQFGGIITCQKGINHRRVLLKHQALQWMTGARRSSDGWDSFRDFSFFERVLPSDKSDKISVIVSDKKFCKGHEKRLEFVAKLKRHLKDRLDIYGTGINPIPDKWDATISYKYHLVLENSILDHYWSEKLADSYLAWAYPIYSGAPNISEYFPENALLQINIDTPDALIQIDNALNENFYERFYSQLEHARNRILFEHNIFPYLARLVRGFEAPEAGQIASPRASNTEIMRIRPEVEFLPGRLLRKAKGMVKKTLRYL